MVHVRHTPAEPSAQPREKFAFRRRHLLWAGAASAAAPTQLGGRQPISAAEIAQPMTSPPSAVGQADWIAFRNRFVHANGRVADPSNGQLSYSHDQGFALLMAEWADDRESFEVILDWITVNLSRRFDALFAHRGPQGGPHGSGYVSNSTLGDIAIAWALRRGAARWGVHAWRQKAVRIAEDTLRFSVRDIDGRAILVPAMNSFARTEHVILNPSYYMFPALRSLATLVPDTRWDRILADGQWLAGAARFGRWGLPPDWVRMMRNGGELRLVHGWSQRFSWDALRLPLFLVWGGFSGAPAVHAAAGYFERAQPGAVPAWIDLRTGEISAFAGNAGVAAVAALVRGVIEGRQFDLPTVSAADDYQGALLVVLARMARQEGAALRPLSLLPGR